MAKTSCAVGEVVGLGVVLAGNAADGKAKGAGEFAADPVQGIEAGTAAGILSAHLADDDVRIGIDAEGLRFAGEGALQRFEQGHVLGDVVVLPADPLGDESAAAVGILDHDSNAGGAGAAVGAAVDVGYEFTAGWLHDSHR